MASTTETTKAPQKRKKESPSIILAFGSVLLLVELLLTKLGIGSDAELLRLTIITTTYMVCASILMGASFISTALQNREPDRDDSQGAQE